jgi:hypothetical protein
MNLKEKRKKKVLDPKIFCVILDIQTRGGKENLKNSF